MTLEEALVKITELETTITNMGTASEGLEVKLNTLTETNNTQTEEINRLKIKNYEYFEQITMSAKAPIVDTPEDKKIIDTSIDDVINSF